MRHARAFPDTTILTSVALGRTLRAASRAVRDLPPDRRDASPDQGDASADVRALSASGGVGVGGQPSVGLSVVADAVVEQLLAFAALDEEACRGGDTA